MTSASAKSVGSRNYAKKITGAPPPCFGPCFVALYLSPCSQIYAKITPVLSRGLLFRSDLEQNGGRMAIFSRSARSFAAEHDIRADNGDIHGLSWLQNELTYHILAFESEQRIPNAVEPACGAMKFLLPSAAMHLERKIAKTSAAYVLFIA
jgi:hypothetical protein